MFGIYQDWTDPTSADLQLSQPAWSFPVPVMAAVSTATKVAAIFGAGGGLGWSVAKAFAAAGYNVAVSRRNAEDLRSMIDEEASSPTASQFHAFPCDVTDQEAVSGVLSEIQVSISSLWACTHR